MLLQIRDRCMSLNRIQTRPRADLVFSIVEISIAFTGLIYFRLSYF